MKVVQVISSLKRDQGGPVRSVQGLVAALNAIGIEAWILSMKDSAEPWITGARKHFRLAKATRYRDCYMAMSGLIDEIKPDIVQFNGIWNIDIHAGVMACRDMHIPYVCSPRGMMEPWPLKQKWLKKRIARFLYQDRDLHRAAALYSTAESEANNLRKLGFGNYIFVAPNGVNLPSLKSGSRDSMANPDHDLSTVDSVSAGCITLPSSRRVLFVSRMSKKKGVIELVEAWSSIKQSIDDGGRKWLCELVYTMNSDEERSYERQVKDRVLALGMSYWDAEGLHGQVGSLNNIAEPDFVFTGPLDDDAKWAAYSRASIFVLPTYSENFGIVVAEALWAGIPAITTKGCPWSDLTDRKCGWWIDLDVSILANTLREAMALTDEERSEMGARGHELVKEKYSWETIAREMIKGYEMVLAGASRQMATR